MQVDEKRTKQKRILKPCANTCQTGWHSSHPTWFYIYCTSFFLIEDHCLCAISRAVSIIGIKIFQTYVIFRYLITKRSVVYHLKNHSVRCISKVNVRYITFSVKNRSRPAWLVLISTVAMIDGGVFLFTTRCLLAVKLYDFATYWYSVCQY